MLKSLLPMLKLLFTIIVHEMQHLWPQDQVNNSFILFLNKSSAVMLSEKRSLFLTYLVKKY